MTSKKPNLDEATIAVVKKMLAMPPKPHEDMKVGKPAVKGKRDPGPKDRASSAKPRGA